MAYYNLATRYLYTPQPLSMLRPGVMPPRQYIMIDENAAQGWGHVTSTWLNPRTTLVPQVVGLHGIVSEVQSLTDGYGVPALIGAALGYLLRGTWKGALVGGALGAGAKYAVGPVLASGARVIEHATGGASGFGGLRTDIMDTLHPVPVPGEPATNAAQRASLRLAQIGLGLSLLLVGLEIAERYKKANRRANGRRRGRRSHRRRSNRALGSAGITAAEGARQRKQLDREFKRDIVARGKKRLEPMRDDLKRAFAGLKFKWLDPTRARYKRRIERLRKAIREEILYQRAEQGKHGRGRAEAGRTTSAERQAESDDEVRYNLSPELVPLFNRMRRHIKATPNMTRTEAFLHYVHDHPEEALASTEDAIADDVRRLEAEEWAQQEEYDQGESEYSDAAE